MEKITKFIKNFLDSQKLGYVATVSALGIPNLSPKGTIIAWDENTLAFADIRSPNTMKNLEKKPFTRDQRCRSFFTKRISFQRKRNNFKKWIHS